MGRTASTASPIAVVLAAGQSQRMGTPKSDLPWGSTTLLGHIIQVVRSDLQWPVVVVQRPRVPEIVGVTTIRNVYPERGLANSLKLGVAAAVRIGGKDSAVGVFLADQPFVTGQDAMTVWETLKMHADCVAVRPRYNKEWGHPVMLWVNRIERGLDTLHGDQGLGTWLRDRKDVFELDIAVTDRPSPAWDLDHPNDYLLARLADGGRKSNGRGKLL